MRVLVVLLLLANIGFFAWSRWIVQPLQSLPSPAPGGRRLLLASEAPQAAPLPTLDAAANANCYSLGPFLDLTEAAHASTSLREAGLEPRQRAGEGAVWAGYWVSLSRIASAGDAEQIVDRLRKAGVGDAYVMPAGDSGPTISLGLFTDKARALRRADEVKALGYEPQITQRQREGTVYWIDVNVKPPGKLPDPASLGAGTGRIFRLEVQPCDASGQGSRPATPAGLPDGVPG